MRTSALSDENGFIKIAAFDHRGSLKKMIDEEKMADFKALCAEVFAPYVNAILVDPLYGEKAIAIAKENNLKVILSREKSGYTDSPQGRNTELFDEHDSTKLKQMGADAIKVLLYYTREAENAESQLQIVKELDEETDAVDNIPLLVEPITYPVPGKDFHKGDAVLHAVQDLHEYTEVLKIEFPANEEDDVQVAAPYLLEIEQQAMQPWVVLSRGMKFNRYKEALKLCKETGCEGFAVGRAVWQEIADIEDWQEVENFMRTTAADRMKELSEIFS